MLKCKELLGRHPQGSDPRGSIRPWRFRGARTLEKGEELQPKDVFGNPFCAYELFVSLVSINKPLQISVLTRDVGDGEMVLAGLTEDS